MSLKNTKDSILDNRVEYDTYLLLLDKYKKNLDTNFLKMEKLNNKYLKLNDMYFKLQDKYCNLTLININLEHEILKLKKLLYDLELNI